MSLCEMENIASAARRLRPTYEEMDDHGFGLQNLKALSDDTLHFESRQFSMSLSVLMLTYGHILKDENDQPIPRKPTTCLHMVVIKVTLYLQRQVVKTAHEELGQNPKIDHIRPTANKQHGRAPKPNPHTSSPKISIKCTSHVQTAVYCLQSPRYCSFPGSPCFTAKGVSDHARADSRLTGRKVSTSAPRRSSMIIITAGTHGSDKLVWRS